MKKEKVTSQPMESKEDWEADSAVDTLMRANEIKSNKELMARVRKKAGRKLKALSGLKNDIRSIDDIKDAYKTKFGQQKKKPMMEDEDDYE